MSKYTTELRYLLETNFDLGLNDYPIFDESYRKVLNDKIKAHFMFREIGFETAGLFKNRLNNKMNVIMPYFNQLYEIEAYKKNIDMTDTHNITSTSKNTQKNTRKNIFSDTPNGELGDVFSENYATNATQDNAQTENELENVTKGKEGNGTYAQVIAEWRNTVINVDELILEELEPLFMQIW